MESDKSNRAFDVTLQPSKKHVNIEPPDKIQPTRSSTFNVIHSRTKISSKPKSVPQSNKPQTTSMQRSSVQKSNALNRPSQSNFETSPHSTQTSEMIPKPSQSQLKAQKSFESNPKSSEKFASKPAKTPQSIQSQAQQINRCLVKTQTKLVNTQQQAKSQTKQTENPALKTPRKSQMNQLKKCPTHDQSPKTPKTPMDVQKSGALNRPSQSKFETSHNSKLTSEIIPKPSQSQLKAQKSFKPNPKSSQKLASKPAKTPQSVQSQAPQNNRSLVKAQTKLVNTQRQAKSQTERTEKPALKTQRKSQMNQLKTSPTHDQSPKTPKRPMDDMRTKEILELRQQIEVLKKENELLRQNQIKTSEKPKKSRQTKSSVTKCSEGNSKGKVASKKATASATLNHPQSNNPIVLKVNHNSKKAGEIFACRSCLTAFEGNEPNAIERHLKSIEHVQSIDCSVLRNEVKRLPVSIRALVSREYLVEVQGTSRCVCLPCNSLVRRDRSNVALHLSASRHNIRCRSYDSFRVFSTSELTEPQFSSVAETHLRSLSSPYLAINHSTRSEKTASFDCNLCKKTIKMFLYRRQDIDRHIKRSGDTYYYYCVACDKSMKNDTRLDEHLNAKQHKNLVKKADGYSGLELQIDFVETFLSIDAAIDNYNHPKVTGFISKYTQHELSSIATVRSKYLPYIYNSAIEEIRIDVGEEDPYWFSIDATTDITGRYVGVFIIGSLLKSDQRHCLNADELGSKSPEDLYKFFVKSMAIFHRLPEPKDFDKEQELVRQILKAASPNCRLFLGDAAGENKKLVPLLKQKFAELDETDGGGFEKLHFVSCLAHGLHNVLKLLTTEYPQAHDLVSKIKEFYSKSPKRRRQWKNVNKKVRLPVKYVETRWLTWLLAVGYIANESQYNALVAAMENFIKSSTEKVTKEKAAAILSLLKDHDTLEEVIIVSTTYKSFISCTRLLERHEMTLEDSVGLIEKLEQILDEGVDKDIVSEATKKKFSAVFSNNEGFAHIRAYVKDKTKLGCFANMEDWEVDIVIAGPATSSDAERSFSVYKSMLRPNRNRFGMMGFKSHLIPRMLFNKLKPKRKEIPIEDEDEFVESNAPEGIDEDEYWDHDFEDIISQ